MTVIVRGLVIGLLGIALLGCDIAIEPSPITTATGSRPPRPTTRATPPANATTQWAETGAPAISCADRGTRSTLVVYGDAADLWIYDLAADERRALTVDGDLHFEYSPAFVSGTCVAFASTEPAAIELMELPPQGARRTIVEEPASIVDFAISPDGRSVFYLQIDFDVDGTFRLKHVGVDGGTPEVVHTFQPSLGRGAGSEDEVSIAFSPDGSTILVANTHEYSKEFPNGAIYLFDATGRTVLQRWIGTHPRWSPDSRTVYFRGYAGLNGQGWFAMDVGTMQATKLAITPGTNGLVVSPDGRHLAYDTSYFGDFGPETRTTGEAPVVYVYDLATGTEARLLRGALEPHWISEREVLVTNAREPGPDSMNSWESLGTVTRIALDGVHSAADMTSTLFASAIYIAR